MLAHSFAPGSRCKSNRNPRAKPDQIDPRALYFARNNLFAINFFVEPALFKWLVAHEDPAIQDLFPVLFGHLRIARSPLVEAAIVIVLE